MINSTEQNYLRFREAEVLFDNGWPDRAVDSLEQVVDDVPDHAAAWELLGRARFATARLKPAEQAFRRVLELQPTNGWAHVALVRTLERQSRHEEAATYRRLAEALGETI